MMTADTASIPGGSGGTTPRRIHLIACGVLRADVAEILSKRELPISVEFLPGGLHDRPHELRERLQQAIDEVSSAAASAGGGCERIVLGYGLCGRGTVGLEARAIPLVVPKVHDCIALFLGSDAAYKREFKRFPGTYYVSAGWYEEKVRPASDGKRRVVRQSDQRGDQVRELARKYGEEAAEMIVDFLSSWQRNYQRAAFIDTGAPRKRVYAEHAKAMAEELGWKYEALEGSVDLIVKSLTVDRSTDEIALIPPHHVSIYDALEGGLRGVPVAANDGAPKGAGQRPRVAANDGAPKGAGQRPRVSARPADAAPSAPHRPVREARVVPEATPVPRPSGGAAAAHVGLGIDAGGTYTDVVIYDRDRDAVLAKSKAPTTKWDFTIGIGHALDGLDADLLRRAELVAVSTTLATNAIVEGYGQRVGLLVMPPYGLFADEDIPHEPKAVIRGRLDITGVELEAVDAAQVTAAARGLMKANDAECFAVSGFASTVNPSQEMEVKRIVRAATGRTVTCGHELSDLLDFRTRAITAVLNARIIPRLERFLHDARRALEARGIRAALMVVKGDGTLMSEATALERPVETIMSGPAASVAGARYLTGLADALVVDVGGTTTDTAFVRGGEVRVSEWGTRVGGWQTHVRALRMRTVGLGGDSLVTFHERRLLLGPRRVAPVAWLEAVSSNARPALDYIENRLDDFAASSHGMEIFVRTGDFEPFELTPRERSVVDALAERPHGASELARKLDMTDWMFLDTSRLEEHHMVQRCGCTPTDLLHATGSFTRWDVEAAARICDLYARLMELDGDEFVGRVMTLAVRRLAEELLLKQMEEEMGDDAEAGEGGGGSRAYRYLMDKILDGEDSAFGIQVAMKHPVIGIGAPVRFFLPEAARILNATPLIPEDADVANAIGAITSSVVVNRSARIRTNDEGRYVVEGLPDLKSFRTLDEAHRHAVTALERTVREAAAQGGARDPELKTSFADRISTTSDGTELFLERRVAVRLEGKPEVALAAGGGA
jgi:N-methylhydantoinase A/oxoprolinase/acetone carboxylase beta subunit